MGHSITEAVLLASQEVLLMKIKPYHKTWEADTFIKKTADTLHLLLK